MVFFCGSVLNIRKVLNNNAVVAFDDNNKEVVVIGKGLGFQRRTGDEVNGEKIEKTFTLTDEESHNKFQSIISEIPLEHILITERIIASAKEYSGKELNDCIYVSLSDHIHMAIERYKKGIVLKNTLVLDIKRFYSDEFKMGEQAVKILREETGLDFQLDEAGFIAFHFVNATMDIDMHQIMEMTKMIEELTLIVESFYKIKFNEDSVAYFRFINNLRLFSQGLFNQTEITDTDVELYKVVVNKYSEASKCTELISDYVFNKLNFEIGTEERLYLTISIDRMVSNERAKNGIPKTATERC